MAGFLFGLKVELSNQALQRLQWEAHLCRNKMLMVRNALGSWTEAHEGQSPFNVSTQQGGTLELCQRDGAGFERDPSVHLQVLAGYLDSAEWSLCPGDRSKTVAQDLTMMTQDNVSFQLKSGTAVTQTNSEAIVLRCPVYHLVLSGDGEFLTGM